MSRLMASVSGIRGIVGETLTPHLAVDAGAAFAAHLGGSGTVIVGRDSRVTGEMIRSAIVAGLTAGGCDVIDIGICATPTTGVMVMQHKAAGGIMITASHNPFPWNGIKFLTAEGCAPDKATATKILDSFQNKCSDFKPAETVGHVSEDNSANATHVELALKTVDVESIRKQNFKVVLDSINGGGGVAGKMLLDALGCDVVHVNGEPTGIFAHTPEPTAENLTDLSEQVRSAGAQVGFAQDPDADRLAVVDENGRYFGEEYTLIIAADDVLHKTPGRVAVNLSTSRMIDKLAESIEGCSVHRSAVGEANVVEVMRREDCFFGGEGNGGIIDPRVVYIRDSLVSMALVLQTMTNHSKPLSEIVDGYPRFALLKQKFPCTQERTAAVLDAVKTHFADQPTSDIDGVRIDWPEGWVHVRGSNTEPIMRVFAEAETEDVAEALIAKVRAVVDKVE